MRRQTLQQKKIDEQEEEAPKEKIKFDIFNDADEGTDYLKKSVLDNVRYQL